jgi:hypothetical protein
VITIDRKVVLTIDWSAHSYWLGHRHHREITERWPLSRYPEPVASGEARGS